MALIGDTNFLNNIGILAAKLKKAQAGEIISIKIPIHSELESPSEIIYAINQGLIWHLHLSVVTCSIDPKGAGTDCVIINVS